MHGIFYLTGTLHHNVGESRNATRKVMVLKNTLATFVLVRNCVLTDAIVSQDDTTG